MVRRLSLASLDSGAESPVYGEEPSASADRGNPAAKPSWACEGRSAAWLTVNGRLRPGVPRYGPNGGLVVSAALPGAHRARSGQTARSALASQLPGFFRAVSPGGITSFQVPRSRATPDNNTVTVHWTLPVQVGRRAPRLAASYDMSVVDQQSGRWYVKDIRASTQPMGHPMTLFASSWVVPRGLRSPRKLTDVHGREG